jgi:hypothetical protein
VRYVRQASRCPCAGLKLGCRMQSDCRGRRKKTARSALPSRPAHSPLNGPESHFGGLRITDSVKQTRVWNDVAPMEANRVAPLAIGGSTRKRITTGGHGRCWHLGLLLGGTATPIRSAAARLARLPVGHLGQARRPARGRLAADSDLPVGSFRLGDHAAAGATHTKLARVCGAQADGRCHGPLAVKWPG